MGQLLVSIATGNVEITYPAEFPEHARSFIEACLAFKPEARPSAQELLQHNFITTPSEGGSRGTIDLHRPLKDCSSSIVSSVLKTEITVADAQRPLDCRNDAVLARNFSSNTVTEE